MSSTFKTDATGARSRLRFLACPPSVVFILLLIPLMLLELVGIAAEGRKRNGTFEGAIMLMAASLALLWNVLGGATMFLARKPIRRLAGKSPFSKV